MTTSRRIAIFARPPVPGRVKTRLAPGLTAPLACGLYRACVSDAITAARAAPADQRWLYWAEAPPQPPPSATAGDAADPFAALTFDALPEPSIRLQRGADLGQRLSAAFSELLRGPEDRAVIMGADCPELDGARITRAFDALSHSDAVFGPARDGGYYLIALRRPEPRLFENVAWSTSRVLEETRARALEAKLRVELLDPLEDLDTPEDLVRLIARLGAAGTASSLATSRALRAMGLLPP